MHPPSSPRYFLGNYVLRHSLNQPRAATCQTLAAEKNCVPHMGVAPERVAILIVADFLH